ncbi:MAG: RDD family protein [Cellvibrionaceae bacterium]
MSDTEHQYPSLLRRFATINYDLLLLMAVSIGYGLIYIGIAKLIFGVTTDRATGLFFQLGWLLTLVGFFCYFWMKGGQTTGMRAWRMKIGTLEGEPPQLMQCIARFLLAPLGWLCFFTSFFDANKQCLHDKLSKTQLILLPKEKKK